MCHHYTIILYGYFVVKEKEGLGLRLEEFHWVRKAFLAVYYAIGSSLGEEMWCAINTLLYGYFAVEERESLGVHLGEIHCLLPGARLVALWVRRCDVP